MVYVISQEGKPLMPTGHHGKVRWLLKRKRAKVVRRMPFTIQLLYGTGSEKVQPVTLGVDTGFNTAGYSASTEKNVLFEAEEKMRTDIPRLMTERREKRRARRNRKMRYREARFDNRRRPDDWLPPSIEAKLAAHQNTIRFIASFLPVSKIVIETAAFNIQKMRNPEIGGEEYQMGRIRCLRCTIRQGASMAALTGRRISSRSAPHATASSTRERLRRTSGSRRDIRQRH